MYEFETWQRDATLYKMTYPPRVHGGAVDQPTFRRANPVAEAEAIDRALELRFKVKCSDKTQFRKPMVFSEDDGRHAWMIRPPRDPDGHKPPSMKFPAEDLARHCPHLDEWFHFGGAAPEAVFRKACKANGLLFEPTPGGACPGMRAKVAAIAKRKLPQADVELWICDTGCGIDIINRDE